MDFDEERKRFNQQTVDMAIDNMMARRIEELTKQRDALAEVLRDCIPTLEDVAQNQKNMVDFGIVEPGFIQMATRTRDLIEKTMVYIQSALAKLDE